MKCNDKLLEKMIKGKVFLICFTLSVAIVAYMIYSASFYRKLSNGDYLFGVLAVAIFTFMLRVLARMIGLDKISQNKKVEKNSNNPSSESNASNASTISTSSTVKSVASGNTRTSYNSTANTSQLVHSQSKRTGPDIGAKTFYFHGQLITVSEELAWYNATRQDFYKKALQVARAYMKIYEGYGDILKFIERGYEDGHKLIQEEILSDLQQGLVKFGIYDENIPQLYSDYCKNNPYWDNAFDDVAEKYLAISRRQEEIDAYRTARRQNRGRFYGAGFGLSGALKASMQAGAMNLATGALHGLFNAGAKAIDVAKAGYKTAELYHSEETRDILFQGIGHHVLHMHMMLWSVMVKRMPPLGRIPVLSANASERAKAIRSNMRTMSKDKVIDVFSEVLLLNPYSEELYDIMAHFVGSNDHTLQRIAKYFDVEM